MYPIHPKDTEKEQYKLFFESLQHVIPCSVCKRNYIRHFQEHPIDKALKNRRELVKWVIDMHNMVNGEIGKKSLSYDTVMQKYEKVYGKKIKLDEEDVIVETEENNLESFENNVLPHPSSFPTHSMYIYIGFLVFMLILIALSLSLK
jgi:hypothetical protein